MSQPGPIQPGANPAKGPGEPSEDVKKGKFKEELQKVQKITKTDEDSQAKKKKKQSQGDLEEEDASAQGTPPAPPPAFTLHETKTTSVYDTKSGTVQEKQIDATSPASKMLGTPSKGLLGSRAPVTSSASSQEEQEEPTQEQPITSSQETSSQSSQSSQASTSEPPTQPQQEQNQEQEPSSSYVNTAPSQDQIDTKENQLSSSTKSSTDETSSQETDHTVLEKLKKDIEKLEKQIKEFEEKGKAAFIPELLTKKQELIEKGQVLEKTLKKVLTKIKEPLNEKDETEVLSKQSLQIKPTKEVKIASPIQQQEVSKDEIEEKTSHVKEPIDAFEEKLQTFAEKKASLEKPILDAKQEAIFDKDQTPLETSLKPLTPPSVKSEKTINPDEKVEAIVKKQAKEKKKKTEGTQTDTQIETSLQDTQASPLTPLQMAPQAPDAPPPSGTLTPKMHELFQTMVGLVMIKNLKTEGLEGTRTEVTLNNPEYAKSPFYNLKIVITEYQTAPGAYNIELQGNSQQNTLIAPTLPKLLNAFADPRSALPFTVNRLEVTIKKEDAEKRVKKVQSTTSGQKDFDDTPG